MTQRPKKLPNDSERYQELILERLMQADGLWVRANIIGHDLGIHTRRVGAECTVMMAAGKPIAKSFEPSQRRFAMYRYTGGGEE